MPRWFTDEERRKYYRDWFQGAKGQAIRRRNIIENAVKARRCPAPRILKQYEIGGDELKRILAAVAHTESN